MREPDVILNDVSVWTFGKGVHVYISKKMDAPCFEVDSQHFPDRYTSLEETKKIQAEISEAIAFVEKNFPEKAMDKKKKDKTLKEQLENLNTISHWMAFSREEVEEVMKETGGFITYCGRQYAISFRPAKKAFSNFVLQRSSCKDGDYKVCLVNQNLVTPFREWK